MEFYREVMEECSEFIFFNFLKCFLAFLILIRVVVEVKKKKNCGFFDKNVLKIKS